MKTVCKRLVSGFLAVMMLSAVMLGTCAATSDNLKASDYFAATEVKCIAMGNGKIVVEFDIIATRTMDELGAISISIYEKQSSGSFSKVKVYTSGTTNGMIETDTGSAYGRLWYQGKAGSQYYAIVGCYAKLGSTDATLAQYTRTITAT